MGKEICFFGPHLFGPGSRPSFSESRALFGCFEFFRGDERERKNIKRIGTSELYLFVAGIVYFVPAPARGTEELLWRHY